MDKSDVSLEAKVVVVTGAGRGIGRAIALAMAARGARVVVNDLGAAVDGGPGDNAYAAAVAEEIRAAGGAAVDHAESVATAPGAERLIALAMDTWGRVDAVVNNAGILLHRADGWTAETIATHAMPALRGELVPLETSEDFFCWDPV